MATRRTSDSTRTPDATRTPKPAAKPTAAKPVEPKAAEAKKPAAPAAAAKRVAKPKASKPVAPRPMQVSEDVRRGMIAEAAYLGAERRGFMNGNEAEDWIAAEKEVDALLSAGSGAGTQ